LSSPLRGENSSVNLGRVRVDEAGVLEEG